MVVVRAVQTQSGESAMSRFFGISSMSSNPGDLVFVSGVCYGRYEPRVASRSRGNHFRKDQPVIVVEFAPDSVGELTRDRSVEWVKILGVDGPVWVFSTLLMTP